MFAGPNGSGKSVLKTYLPKPLLGVYLNPDEIEAGIRKEGSIDLRGFKIETEAAEALSFLANSTLLKEQNLTEAVQSLSGTDTTLHFNSVPVNAYFASVLVDFLRGKLLDQHVSFTCETVMSHESKVDLLRDAQNRGYRTYLYYVATEDPLINISRVHNRVALGGHPVPDDKIESRYHRSLKLLIAAIHYTNRAYLFDNSTDNADSKLAWVAEITEGHTLELKTNRLPSWLKRAVLDKLT